MKGDQNPEPATTPKHKRHSFVIRIWIEPREIAGEVPQWRGIIQHALYGDQRHLKDLDEIIGFIEPYMTDMGIKPSRTPWLNHNSASNEEQ